MEPLLGALPVYVGAESGRWRVAFTAASVIVISSAAALYEIKEERDAGEPFANEFAIADSAIQSEFPQ